jgi:hypothetical protein
LLLKQLDGMPRRTNFKQFRKAPVKGKFGGAPADSGGAEASSVLTRQRAPPIAMRLHGASSSSPLLQQSNMLGDGDGDGDDDDDDGDDDAENLFNDSIVVPGRKRGGAAGRRRNNVIRARSRRN